MLALKQLILRVYVFEALVGHIKCHGRPHLAHGPWVYHITPIFVFAYKIVGDTDSFKKKLVFNKSKGCLLVLAQTAEKVAASIKETYKTMWERIP